MADTPPFRHVVPAAGETTDQYRLRVLENAVMALAVRFDKHMDHVQKNELVQREAITRCKRHDDDVQVLREKATEHDTAIKVLQETVANEHTQTVVVGKTWADVLFHPATPMAFCIAAMIYFFTLYISATSGRDFDTLRPHPTATSKDKP